MSLDSPATSKTVAVVVSAMLLALVMLVGSCRAQTPEPLQPPQQQDNVVALATMQQDLSIVALINRLSLSPQQAKELLSIASRVREAMHALQAPRQQATAHLLALLERQLDLMLRDEQPPAALTEQIAQAELELQRIDEQAQHALLPFAAEARKVLSQAQVMIISGQDEARQAAEEMLMWIRELSAEDFAGEGRSNAEALAIAEIGLDADTVFNVFRTARSLSPEQYAAQVDELAEKLGPLYRPEIGGEDLAIGRMLANERFIPVLELRMKHLSDGSGQG